MTQETKPVYVAIDPGTTHSAFLAFASPQEIFFCAKMENREIENRLREFHFDWLEPSYSERKRYHHLAIEMVASYGMPVGEEVFETCLWVGRFLGAYNGPFTKIKRHEIKMHLCHTIKGVSDSAIRQRLIDLYGGKEQAIGKKASPGPLYGFAKDQWQALAVAVVWWEKYHTAPAPLKQETLFEEAKPF